MIFAIVNSFSQVRFQKTYEIFGEINVAFSNASKDSNNYFIGLTTYDPSITQIDFCLIKTDFNGDTLWSKIYGGGGANGLSYLTEDSNNNLFLKGTFYGFGTGYAYNNIHLLKTNSLGDTLWSKLIGNSRENILLNSIGLNEQKNLLVLNNDTTFLQIGDACIIKIDCLGNILLNKSYGGADQDLLVGVIPLSNEDFILSGATKSYGAGNFDAYILRIDSLGNIIWAKGYGGGQDETAYSILKTDNGFITLGETRSYGQGGADILLMKYDFNGNVLWAKTYGTNIDEGGSRILKNSNSHFIITGFGPHVTTSGNRETFLMEIDSLGNLQWAKKYGTSSCHENFGDISFAPDGGFLLSGSTRSFGGFDYKGYIAKVDAFGNSGCFEQNVNFISQDITSLLIQTIVNPNVYTDTTIITRPLPINIYNAPKTINPLCYSVVSVEENENNKRNLTIYPNPSSNEIIIEFEQNNSENIQITIQNVLGQTVYSESMRASIDKQTKILDISSLQNGLYFVQLKDHDVVYSVRFIKQ